MTRVWFEATVNPAARECVVSNGRRYGNLPTKIPIAPNHARQLLGLILKWKQIRVRAERTGRTPIQGEDDVHKGEEFE
jgi:hypothetical protein